MGYRFKSYLVRIYILYWKRMRLTKINWDFSTAILHCKAIEDEAIEQIKNICNHPAMAWCNIAIMPDAHSWAWCVIWFTSTINDKIIPNLVWVDIGCWMAYAKFKADEINFEALDKYIRENIPSWFDINDKFQLWNTECLHLDRLKCEEHINKERAELSVWTLWWWNHFIEIDKDDKWYYYLVIHSWSRYLWKQVCEYYQNLAYEKCKTEVKVEWKTRAEMIEFLKSEWRQKEIQSYKEIYHQAQDNSIDKDTAYLRWEDKDNYINDALICKDYAKLNRMCMALKILQFLWVEPEYLRETVHNYIDTDWIIRKWAIKNEWESLIPINMRDWAFIVESKWDNWKERNNSLPHWAGRLMSRWKARATISVEEFKKSMEWIYSSCVSEATLDESPMAYKSIDNIQDVIWDVCVIKEHIKPVYNFKAS